MGGKLKNNYLVTLSKERQIVKLSDMSTAEVVHPYCMKNVEK